MIVAAPLEFPSESFAARIPVKNVVQLADEKLFAHVDRASGEDATRVVLERFMSVDGVVQTNIIAVVRPKKND